MEPDYIPRELSAPSLTGILLKAFVSLAESSIFGVVRSSLLRKNRIPQLLEETTFPEEPLYYPDTNNWPVENRHTSHTIVQDAEGSEAATAASAALTLDFGDAKSLRCFALELHNAYLINIFTPSHMAEALIEAVAESESTFPMRLFISHNPDAIRAAAAESTARYAAGKPLSPLDGVPFGVKDLLDFEGYPTTAGTAYLGQTRQVNGTFTGVVALLEAGAIMAGKQNLHEIGLGTTGLNPVHGTPLNPYNIKHHTGGSSSGSAAAVAAGLLPFSVGTDGGGSIRIPSALCGCVGLKPTSNRVCARPCAEFCYTVGVAGPIAGTVADCVLLYAMLANKGHEKYRVPVAPLLALPALSAAELHDKPLAGLTGGVHWAWFEDADPYIVALCKRAVDVLVSAGMQLKEISIPGLHDLSTAHAVTISSEMRGGMSDAAMDRSKRRQLNAETRISLAVADGFSAAAYVNAQKIRHRADSALRRIFTGDDQGVDIIITPASPIPAPRIRPGSLTGGISDLKTTTLLMQFCQLGNMLGLPAIVVPVGPVPAPGGGPDLPMGLQLMGPAFHEATLLHTAAVLEAHVGVAGGMQAEVDLNLVERAMKKAAEETR